jgi:hypothetical protein
MKPYIHSGRVVRCASAAGDGANSIKLFGQPSTLEAAAAAAAAAGAASSSSPQADDAADAAAPGTPKRAREQDSSDEQLNGVLQDPTSAAAAAVGDAAGNLKSNSIMRLATATCLNSSCSQSHYAIAFQIAGTAWECLVTVQQAHDADVNCVRWHPSRQGFLASAGDDGLVKLWQYTQQTQSAAGAAAPAAAAADVAAGS